MKVTIDQKAKTLTIVLPLRTPATLSSTGKTLIHATTSGNKESEVAIDGQNIIVGVNAYTYATPKQPRA